MWGTRTRSIKSMWALLVTIVLRLNFTVGGPIDSLRFCYCSQTKEKNLWSNLVWPLETRQSWLKASLGCPISLNTGFTCIFTY